MPWSGTWTPAPQNTIPSDATGPFPILIPAEPPQRQSRLVLLGVATALVIGLVLAVFSLRDFGKSDDSGDQTVTPVTATSDAATAAPSAPATSPRPSATPSAAATPGASAVAPVIARIISIDPQGDGNENTSSATKATDGDSSTQWRSDRYKSAASGGLKKGLGLAIQLKQPAVISAVTVQVRGSGGAVQLRAGNSDDVSQSTVLDSAAVNGGTVTLTSTSSGRASWVIIWFTKLPSTGGDYRAEVTEVRVT